MKRLIYLCVVGLFISLTSCLEDDNTDQLVQEEITNLKSYLATRNITFISMDTIYMTYSDTTRRDSASAFTGADDFALVNYNICLLSGELVETNNFALASSKKMVPVASLKGPIFISMAKPPLAGVHYALRKMKPNDSANFIIPSNMALGSYASADIPAYSTLIYQVKLVKTINDPVAYDKSFWNRWVRDSLNKVDPNDPTIANLADTTEDGVYIKVTKAGVSDILVEDNELIKVAYKGYLADGRSFSSDYDTISFTVGAGKLIDGFENAMIGLHQNSNARIFIPYNHAYGIKGKQNSSTYQINIPPYSSLYYEVVIVDAP